MKGRLAPPARALPAADPPAVRDRNGPVVERVIELAQAAVGLLRWTIHVRRHLHRERLVRAVVVVVLEKASNRACCCSRFGAAGLVACCLSVRCMRSPHHSR